MPSGKAITIETWADYQAMRRQGKSLYAAAKECGISYHACRDAESGKAPRNYIAAQEALGKTIQPEVPEHEEHSPDAQAAYDNIEIFAQR